MGKLDFHEVDMKISSKGLSNVIILNWSIVKQNIKKDADFFLLVKNIIIFKILIQWVIAAVKKTQVIPSDKALNDTIVNGNAIYNDIAARGSICKIVW